MTRAERKLETRSAIIEAAARLFVRNGIEATSIDAIAASIRLTKGAVYGSFRSKHELIEAVAEQYSAPADVAPLLRVQLVQTAPGVSIGCDRSLPILAVLAVAEAGSNAQLSASAARNEILVMRRFIVLPSLSVRGCDTRSQIANTRTVGGLRHGHRALTLD